MKKIFLIITLIICFVFPVKADTYEDAPYFIAISYMDLTQLGMGNETPVQITWYFTHDRPPVKRIYANVPRLMNMSTTMAYGKATVDAGNGTVLTADFEWNSFEDHATIDYMGLEFIADNFTYPTGQDDFIVGNGYEWWSSQPQVDLTITESCLLIILFICAINLICGKE